MSNKKDKRRKDFIAKHGRCCETCDRDPTNHGQRDSCTLDTICTEENNYPNYREANQIYSIDIKYCC